MNKIPTASFIQGNLVSGISYTSTSNAGTFYFLYLSTGLYKVGTTSPNIIGSATTAGAITYAGSGTLYGLYSSSSNPANAIENNIIGNWSLTGTTGSPYARGLYVYCANVKKNKIFNISCTNAGLTPYIYGIYNYSYVTGVTNEYSNNLVSLDAGAATNPVIYGYYDYGWYATPMYNFYYNDISVSGPATGTSSTYAFYRSYSTLYLMNNNIISNTRLAGGTGKHYAAYVSTTGNLGSNYNDIYSTAGPLGYYNAADQLTFTAFKTATVTDANSVNVNPQFVSSSDLHTCQAALNNAGIAVSGVTTDYAGVTRGNPPDIGSYEFSVPVPTITGVTSFCGLATGVTYTTESGMTGYSWTVSAGGSITAGSGTNQITVSWNALGAQTVSVTYFNTNGCSPLTPTVKNVSVYAVPVPTITGASSICGIPSTGNHYTTEAGMTGYTWTVSAGGAITAGDGTNNITVTWSTAGTKSVTVSYTSVDGCTPTTPSSHPVMVHALPVATITGAELICGIPSSDNHYSTEAGMSTYDWTVSTGGTVTAGAGTNDITVQWTTTGAKTITVTYIDANGCTPAAPASKSVGVHTTPTPIITGTNLLCGPATGFVYSTEAGMTGYLWSVSAGGTITAGEGTKDITVSWTTAGSQTVSVNYSDVNGCSAVTPTSYPVQVNAKPVPTITGPGTVVVNSSGVVYSTETGMTGYTWAVSAGVTITAGGTASDHTITVTFNTAGPQTVSVNYTNSSSCTASAPTVKNVSVTNIPGPAGTITGVTPVCQGQYGVAYSVAPVLNATGYVWSLPTGATIATGSNTNSITVNYSGTAVSGVINVYGTNPIGNGDVSPDFAVTVNPMSSPTISGVNELCVGTTGVTYTTESGKAGYTWAVSEGGIITAGQGTNQITVTWNWSGNMTVYANYENSFGCIAVPPASYPVLVNPKPADAGTITGPTIVQQGQTGVAYSIVPVLNATGYVWTLPTGGTIATGANTNAITVNYSASATPGNMSVHATNGCGNGLESPNLYITFGVNISGLFQYNNTVYTPLDSVWVILKLNSIKVDSTRTDLTGAYLFTGKPNGTYTISAHTGKPWQSVNATDAVKVQRHFAGLELLTEPVRLLAADVNLSNSINGTDAVKIKRRFSNLDNYFDRGDWTFAKETIGGDTIIVAGVAVTQNFYGLVVGDVNGSNIPAPGKSAQSLVSLVQDGEMIITAGQEFDVPVRIQQAAGLGAVSLVLNYPSDNLSITNVTIKQGNLMFKAAGNELRIAWSELEPLMLQSGEALITLHMKAAQSLGSEVMTLSLNGESELADGVGQVIPDVTLTAPVLKTSHTGVSENNALTMVSVYPNPAQAQVTIEYQLTQASVVSVEILNVYGQILRQHEATSDAVGKHAQVMDVTDIAEGVYMVKVKYQQDGKDNARILKLVIRK